MDRAAETSQIELMEYKEALYKSDFYVAKFKETRKEEYRLLGIFYTQWALDTWEEYYGQETIKKIEHKSKKFSDEKEKIVEAVELAKEGLKC